MILSGLIFLTLTGASQAAPTTGKLVGATVQVNGAAAVRLRWMMDEGWIPNGGFNLYRSDGSSTPVKLNSTPLTVKGSLALTDQVYKTAIQPVRITGAQAFMAKSKVGRQSSSTTFAAMRASVKGVTGAAGGPPTTAQIHTAITKTSAVSTFMSSLPRGSAQPQKRVFTANEKIAIARSHLAMSAMTLPGAADTLGMGYDDTKVTGNASYTYTLKAINNGSEGQVATFSITVGKDALPPAPIVEEPVQTGVGAMSLHFEVPQGVDESNFGIFYYKVTRTDSAHLSGLVLSNGHIVPTYQTTTTGVEVASLVTYLDQGRAATNRGGVSNAVPPVAVGNVTYAVQLFDSFGRNNGAPVTVTTVCKDIAPPGPVTGATATYQAPTGVGGKQFVIVNFTPSVGDATVVKPNPTDVSYLYQRRDADDPKSTWSNVSPTPVALAYAQESELTVRQLSSLYPGFQATAKAAAQRSLTRVAPGSKSTFSSKLVAVGQMRVPAFKAANPGLIAVGMLYEVGKFADTTVQPDHHYQYQVIPVLKRNSVAGNMADTTPVGVPALVPAPAPAGLAIADAVAPMNLKFPGSATNVLKLQSTHGIFTPNSLVPTGPSIIRGPQVGQTIIQSRPLASSRTNPLRNVVQAVQVAANYGRMETISWTASNYSSACSYKVYRANGTGYTSNTSAEIPPNRLLNASADAQGAKLQAGKTSVGSRPVTVTTIQNPKAISAGLPKQRSTLAGVGAFHGINSRLIFAFDSPPPLAAYSLLGQTAPGATTFIDLIPRSQTNMFYYYVVPVSRWGTVGTATAPVKVKTLPSLPPSVPVFVSASPTETETLAAAVQPNLTTEDVVEYRLYRMPFPSAPMSIRSGVASAVLSVGKVSGLAKSKSATTQVSRTVGTRPLIATGNGIAGGAKFGILQTESAAVSLSAYQGKLAASVFNKTAAPTISAELQALFPLSNYTQVASSKVDPSNTATVTVTDTTAVPGVEYVYRIVAVDSAGLVSDPSTVIDAMALKLWCDPPALSGQAAYAAATNTVTFSLVPPATGCQAFVVERAIDAAATKFVQLKILAANGTTPVVFTDTAVRPGQTYTYHVSCIDSAGNSSKRTGVTDNAAGTLSIVVKT